MKLKYIGLLFVGLFFSSAFTCRCAAKIESFNCDGARWKPLVERGVPMLFKKYWRNSDRFKVEVAVTPPLGQDISSFRPTFKSFDLVVVNYGGTTWPKDTQRDMEQYMEAGGALVVIHSAIVPMADWPEYNKMTALGACGWT
jgi:hypothetical protein